MYPIVKDTLELIRKSKECKTHEARTKARQQVDANLKVMDATAIRQLNRAQAEA